MDNIKKEISSLASTFYNSTIWEGMKASSLTTSAFKPLLSKVFQGMTGIEPPLLKPGVTTFTIGLTMSHPTYLTNFGPTFTLYWIDLGAVEYRHLWSKFFGEASTVKITEDWPLTLSLECPICLPSL